MYSMGDKKSIIAIFILILNLEFLVLICLFFVILIYRIQKQILRLSSKFKFSSLVISNKVKKFLK